MAAIERAGLGAQVCVMAKAPIAGRVKTRLCPPYRFEQSAALAEAFLLDTWSVADSAFVSSAVLAFAGELNDFPKQLRSVGSFRQNGADLGERISSAIATTLAMTLSSAANPSAEQDVVAALVVGSDLPGLPATHLHNALELLVDHDVCIGPSGDGGFYLIGARRWIAGSLTTIDWSTEKAREQTISDLRGRGLTVALAAEYNDIDDIDDLNELIGSQRLAPQTRRAYDTLDCFD